MGARRSGGARRSEAEWRAIVSQYKQSGESQASFCRQAGIPPAKRTHRGAARR
jgi:hypothetical protein